MKPGMKMMLAERARQGGEQPESEYGGKTRRRMIGYDRDERMENRGRMPMRQIPPDNEMAEYAERGAYAERGGYAERGSYPDRGAYSERGAYSHNWPHDPPWYGGEREGAPESRRRRDKRGRFMMDEPERDDDDEDDYRPRNRMRANKYGDIYAEGMIYAPRAMNRPMSGDANDDMSDPVDEQTARMWVNKMDGGEHFKAEHAEQLRAATCPECERWEFYVAINAMYNDHCASAKKFGIDKPEYYAQLAKEFLQDEDAKRHKLRKYMTMIAKG